jgi:putative nucleotidyltransferase with HDIG domain
MSSNQRTTDDVNFNQSDEEMVAVGPDEFVRGTYLPTDIFIQLSDKKFVLIARKGTKADLEQMHLAEHIQSAHFYVRKSEFKNCVGQNLTVAGIVMARPDFPKEKKAQFLKRTADSVFKELEEVGFNLASIEHAKMISQSVQTLIQSQSDLGSALEMMNGISNELVRHSMTVSAISIIIAHSIGWKNQSTLEKVALGALLHDIGMKELPQDIVNRPRHQMTYEEQQIYESHAFRGMETLRSMPSIPEDILKIVYEHHENSIGQGYPRKLRDYKMNPLAKVVALADGFADLTMKNVNNSTPRTPAETVHYIENTLGQPYNKAVFMALKSSLVASGMDKKKAAV